MPLYACRALDERQAASSGTVAAETPRQARDLLRSRGLAVESLTPRRPPTGAFAWRRRGRYDARMVPVVRELATLQSAAIPLSEALETVTRVTARAA